MEVSDITGPSNSCASRNKLKKREIKVPAKLGVIVAILFLAGASRSWADMLTVELTRFGACINLAACQQVITDGPGPGGVIAFSATVGELPDGIFQASGTLTETDVLIGPTSASAILLNLTNLSVQGIAGGIGSPPIISGEIGVISSVPVVAPNGVFGFAFLVGQYQDPSGVISSADLILQARADGILLGLVDAGMVANVRSPVAFAGFDARPGLGIPVDNLLIGTLDFQVAAGDGFFLPGSAQAEVQAIPEPSALILLGCIIIGIFVRTYAARSVEDGTRCKCSLYHILRVWRQSNPHKKGV